MKLFLNDTLSGDKKEFSTTLKKKLNIYVCGITPYSYSHLGHGRSYINFDILIRTLLFLEFDVNFIRNFTDIDDKMIKRAQEELGDWKLYPVLAERYIKDFHVQMDSLNCLRPTVEPRATESIPEITEIIKILLKKNIAYKAGEDIFFDISKFNNYGKLSKKKLEDLEPGSRIQINEFKKNPLDFVLWKGAHIGDFWETEIGSGRPGWHIECSAMIYKYCGEYIDIHGGGSDLIFPHHENEIAQSEACFGKTLSSLWMHNGFISIDQNKMSKSLGNSIGMNDYFKNHQADEFRFYILQHNYKSPIDFTEEKINSAGKAKKTLCDVFNKMDLTVIPNFTISTLNKLKTSLTKNENFILEKIIEELLNDLNTAGAIGLIFKHLSEIKENKNFATLIFSMLNSVLGVVFSNKVIEEKEIPAEVLTLIEKRNIARSNKDWILSDKLREEIIKLGFSCSDKILQKK